MRASRRLVTSTLSIPVSRFRCLTLPDRKDVGDKAEVCKTYTRPFDKPWSGRVRHAFFRVTNIITNLFSYIYIILINNYSNLKLGHALIDCDLAPQPCNPTHDFGRINRFLLWPNNFCRLRPGARFFYEPSCSCFHILTMLTLFAHSEQPPRFPGEKHFWCILFSLYDA